MSVDLPAPFSPQQGVDLARAEVEIHAHREPERRGSDLVTPRAEKDGRGGFDFDSWPGTPFSAVRPVCCAMLVPLH